MCNRKRRERKKSNEKYKFELKKHSGMVRGHGKVTQRYDTGTRQCWPGGESENVQNTVCFDTCTKHCWQRMPGLVRDCLRDSFGTVLL
jgi:hypothetical protein